MTDDHEAAVRADERRRTEQWWRVLLLSITRNMVLSDHLGDAWGGVREAWRCAGMGELPAGDGDELSLSALDEMGALGFYGPGAMQPRPDDSGEPAPYGGAPLYRCTNPKCDWYARLSDVDNNTRCTCGRRVTLPAEPAPVEWVDGRATVGTIRISLVYARHEGVWCAVFRHDDVTEDLASFSCRDDDQGRVEQLAVTVAREMQR